MSGQPQPSKSIFAGWHGTEERPALCDNAHVLEGFNVDFVDGTIQRRRGSVKLMAPTQFRPTQILTATDGFLTNTGQDITSVMTDGDLVSPTLAAGGAIWVGSPNKFSGIRFTLASPSVAAAVTMTVQIFDWQNNFISLTITDGTAVGGSTLHQTGNVTWATTQFPNWLADNGTQGAFVASGSGNPISIVAGLYWAKVTVSGAPTGCNIAEIAGLWQGSDGIMLLGESTGMTEFVTLDGDRFLVNALQFPSRYVDAHQGFLPDPKVLAYDLSRGDTIPIFTELASRNLDAYAGRTTFASMNGWLIGSSPSGLLWKFNGKSSGKLESLAGNDYLQRVVGAQGYLNSTPRGWYLDTYHSKLMVAGSPTTPLTFYASLPDNDLINIPPGATVGGANVWPINGTYTIPGKSGDYITGTSVVNDRYVIFTRSQTWVFDESSLRLANGDVGCIAPGSVQRIDNGIFFLSDQGVFIHDSINAKAISQPIERTLFDRVNWKAAPLTATSVHHKRKGEYWLFLPINGEWQNRIAVVFNYIKQYWRIVGSWYPFDTNTRRDSLSAAATFSAGCGALASDGKQALILADNVGALWQHDIGYDDNGFVYPAYAILNRLSSYSRFLSMAASDSGEDYVSFREWYININMDGSWLECCALEDGERFDQELDRRFANLPTNSEIVQKQALIQNAVQTNATEQTYATVASWPVAPHFSQSKKLKMSFGRHVTKMQPVVHWPGGQYVAGSYTNGQVAASGAIYDIQVSGKPLPVGR